MKVLERKEMPFPEDLEGRLNAVYSIINNEFKTVTFLHLSDIPTNRKVLMNRMRETVGKEVYLPREQTLEDYCSETFFLSGTVAEVRVRTNQFEGTFLAYSVTDWGKRFGLPIAALALRFVYQNQRSLFEILGSMSTRGKSRAPLNRVKMLKLLSAKGKLRMVDLTEETGLLTGARVKTLASLQRAGLVEYESVGEIQKGKGIITYLWAEGKNPEDIQGDERNSRATRIAAGLLLKSKGRFNNFEGEKLLGIDKTEVSRLYSSFVKEGFAVRENGFVGRKKHSEVIVRENAKSFLELERNVEGILTEEIPLREGQLIYLETIHSREYAEMIRQAIEFYRQVSPLFKRKTKEEMNRAILASLKERPGQRYSEIERSLNYSNIVRYLTPLIESGVLHKVKNGRGTRYFVVE